MDLLLFLLRLLLGTSRSDMARLQPLQARRDGRLQGERQSSLLYLRIAGIGWLTLPERFRRSDAYQRWERENVSPNPWLDDWNASPKDVRQ